MASTSTYNILIYKLSDGLGAPHYVDSFVSDVLPFDITADEQAHRRYLEALLEGKPGRYFIIGVYRTESLGRPSSWSWLLTIPPRMPQPEPTWESSGCEPTT